MGTKAKVMHGSRAQLYINGQICGIFNSINTGVTYDNNAVYVLGRFSAAEIALTGMEPISLTAAGFRVIGSGPHTIASVPKLQELLNHEDITLSLFDRQTNEEIMTIVGVRPVSYTTDVAARGLHGLSVNFIGLVLSDEAGPQDEEATATKF